MTTVSVFSAVAVVSAVKSTKLCYFQWKALESWGERTVAAHAVYGICPECALSCHISTMEWYGIQCRLCLDSNAEPVLHCCTSLLNRTPFGCNKYSVKAWDDYFNKHWVESISRFVIWIIINNTVSEVFSTLSHFYSCIYGSILSAIKTRQWLMVSPLIRGYTGLS